MVDYTKDGPNWCGRCQLPFVGMHGTAAANCRCPPRQREPYGPGIDGPEVGQGIDAPWLDEPDSERTQRADHIRDEQKDPRNRGES